MTNKTYLGGILIATIFCWAVFALTLFSVNPFKADSASFISFYLSLFFGLTGIFTLINYSLRSFFGKSDDSLHHTGTAFRQAFLLALSIVGILFLQSQRMLNWWDGSLLVAAILLLELFFRAK